MLLYFVMIGALIVISAALLTLAVVEIVRFIHSNSKSALLEGKMVPDSKRIIWRITNTGVRNFTVVEIGLKCADKYASYRPLYSATDDVNTLPYLLVRGDIASYRKEMERFMFRQSEADQLKISNPYVYFYCKDAEGKVYSQRSDYKFVQYFTMISGGGH